MGRPVNTVDGVGFPQNPLVAPPGHAISQGMSDTLPDAPTAVERIDAAIARIESAIAARAESGDALAKRHAALKARMAEAVAALDDVITRGSSS